MSKKLITLVLESYQGSCRAAEGRKKDERLTGTRLADACMTLVSSVVSFNQGNELCMFRNILMDAELTPDEVAEVDLVLKKVEAQFTDALILESVRMIRGRLITA